MYNKKTKKIQDLPWTHSVIRLIRKAKVPVYPVYFDFLNSRFFYWLGRIDWRIRTLRIPAEAFNKRGRTSMFISVSLFLQKKSKILPTTKTWPSFYINVRTLLKNNKPV